MKTNMLIISAILFLISQGSIYFELIKNRDNPMNYTSRGQKTLLVLTFLPYIMLNISMNDLLKFKWYWVLIMTFALNFVLSKSLAQLYSSIFGIKTNSQLSLREGGYVRHNLHILDGIITLVLGTVIYFVASYLV